MEIALIVLIGALVAKFTDFLKFVRAGDVNASLTQLSAWAAGVAAVFLGSATDFAGTAQFNRIALNDLNSASKVLLGLLATSLFSVVYDLKKAIDPTDSAKTPQLVTGTYGDVGFDHGSTYDVSGDANVAENAAWPNVETKEGTDSARANWPQQ